MTLLDMIVAIVVVGVVLWAINVLVPMQPTVKQILNAVVLIVLFLWLARGLGLFHGPLWNQRVGCG